MKLFKIFTLLSLFLIIGLLSYNYYANKKTTYEPISTQNNFFKNLDIALKKANLNTGLLQIRDFNNEVEFYLVLENNQIKVLISTLKDPFWQVATLQQVVKTAKINQEKLKLVDLSSKHPYVTLKNN